MYKDGKYVYEIVEAQGRLPRTGVQSFILYNKQGKWYSTFELLEGNVEEDVDGVYMVTTEKYTISRIDRGVSRIEVSKFKKGDYIIPR